MGSADYLRLGDWNIRCDRCGKKMKASEAKKTWDGLYVCDADWEPRHPQDFVKAVKENSSPDFVRAPPDRLLGSPVGIIAETDNWPFDDMDLDYIMTEGGILYFLTEG